MYTDYADFTGSHGFFFKKSVSVSVIREIRVQNHCNYPESKKKLR
jgi:hypothetical protein